MTCTASILPSNTFLILFTSLNHSPFLVLHFVSTFLQISPFLSTNMAPIIYRIDPNPDTIIILKDPVVEFAIWTPDETPSMKKVPKTPSPEPTVIVQHSEAGACDMTDQYVAEASTDPKAFVPVSRFSIPARRRMRAECRVEAICQDP